MKYFVDLNVLLYSLQTWRKDRTRCISFADIVYDFLSEEEEKVEERVYMKSWNPVSCLLYRKSVTMEFIIMLNIHIHIVAVIFYYGTVSWLIYTTKQL